MERKPGRLYVKRVWIDSNYCTLSTLCEGEAPELIDAQGSDLFVVRESALQRTQEELKQLLEASGVCWSRHSA